MFLSFTGTRGKESGVRDWRQCEQWRECPKDSVYRHDERSMGDSTLYEQKIQQMLLPNDHKFNPTEILIQQFFCDQSCEAMKHVQCMW